MDNYFSEIFMLASKHFYREYKDSGGSQKNMAREVGVTTSYISAVMNGSRTASIALSEKVAFMLSGKPLDEFLAVGRRIKKGLPPVLEKEKAFLDSPEELISKLTYYIVNYHRLEKALKDEQWLFQEAINMADYGIVIVSADRKVLAYNKTYQEIFGYPEEILATKDLRAYVRYGRNKIADLEKFERDIQEALVTITPVSHLVGLKNGRTIQRDTFPLFRDGTLVGRLVHLTDVTSPRKRKR